MAIEVEISGTGAFAGHKSNLSSYSYTEESTPATPGDSSGGVGEISFDVNEDSDNTILLYRDSLRLTDSFSGSVSGLIDTVSSLDGISTVSGRSKLGLLNTDGTVAGGATTLGAYFTALLNAGGITSNIDIDASITSRPLIAPTVTGDLWVLLKDLCTAEQVELALVDDTVVVRPLRARTIAPLNLSSEGWDVADKSLAQFVEVNYYNYSTVTNSLVYPKGGWTSDVQVYQVDAGQTLVVDIPVDFYLTSIQQPTVQTTVSRTYTGPDSVYSVAGNDGLPIPTAQWSSNGGALTVALKENGSVIEATIVGANIPNLAPFRIAVSSGPSDYYSTLRLVGSGVSFTQETLTWPTGLTESETPIVVGITIDNKFIDSRQDAIQAATYARVPYALPSRTYGATARVVNRSSLNGPAVIYPAFEQWESGRNPADTFASFNTEFSGDTFQDFTDALLATVVNDFENQAFGNVAGSRVRFRDAWFRVRGAESSQDEISFSAEFDTMFSDFNAENPGATFSNFNAIFTGLTFTDFALIPLRTA